VYINSGARCIFVYQCILTFVTLNENKKTLVSSSSVEQLCLLIASNYYVCGAAHATPPSGALHLLQAQVVLVGVPLQAVLEQHQLGLEDRHLLDEVFHA